ncbi:MAG: DMT family transporter, partial [Bacteroidota bacterium]
MSIPAASPRQKALAHLALLAVAIIYSLTYFIVATVFEQIPPLGTVALRAAFALVFFGLILKFVIKEPIRERKDHIRLFFCGLTGIAINQAFFFWGLSFTVPIHASVLMTTSPLFVFIAAAILKTEKLTPLKIMGLGVAFAGALTLTVRGQDISMAPNMLLGDTMILINAASYGLYLVIVRPLMAKYKPLTIVFWIYLYGAMFNIPAGTPDL